MDRISYYFKALRHSTSLQAILGSPFSLLGVTAGVPSVHFSCRLFSCRMDVLLSVYHPTRVEVLTSSIPRLLIGLFAFAVPFCRGSTVRPTFVDTMFYFAIHSCNTFYLFVQRLNYFFSQPLRVPSDAF